MFSSVLSLHCITARFHPILIDFSHFHQSLCLALARDIFIRPFIILLDVAMYLQKCFLLRRPPRPVRIAPDRQLDTVGALHKIASHDLPLNPVNSFLRYDRIRPLEALESAHLSNLSNEHSPIVPRGNGDHPWRFWLPAIPSKPLKRILILLGRRHLLALLLIVGGAALLHGRPFGPCLSEL